jgi:threonine/homoserine/homoserine lactone efflux protein
VVAATSEWERWFVLLPAFVVGGGLIAGTLILLGRALAQSVRESGHTRLIMVGFGVVLAACVVLTYLGVSLPRE